MSVVAKFKVTSVQAFETHAQVKMNPVYAPPGADPKITDREDGAFWQATPSGELTMTINNQAAAEQFQPGAAFYLTFEPVDAPVD